MNSNGREVVNINNKNNSFLEINQQVFTELLTFIDFVDNKLNIGFVEINFAKDRNILIEALVKHQNCQDIQFEVLDFPDPNLGFLRDELVKKLKEIKIIPDKKLILLITGLEKSIGVVEEYPDVLVNLNFSRDDLRISVPHPLLLFLPDYALTRLAKYAPDFWAWGRKIFYFKTVGYTIVDTLEKNINFKESVDNLQASEKQERIDLLLRLLSEYRYYNLQEVKSTLSIIINIYNQLGNAYDSLREYQKAIDYNQKALKIAQQIDDKSTIAYSLIGLGNNYYSTKEYQKAIECYMESLWRFEDIGDYRGIACSFMGLGNVYSSLEDYLKVIRYYQKLLQILQELDDQSGIAYSLGHLGITYECREEYQKAIDYYQQSLEIFQEIGDRNNIASCLGSLGNVFYSLKDYLQAIDYYQQSLEIFQEIDNPTGIASSLVGLGNTYKFLGNYSQAIGYYEQSLKIFQEIGNKEGIICSLNNLGHTYYFQEDHQQAIKYYQQSLEIAQEIGDQP